MRSICGSQKSLWKLQLSSICSKNRFYLSFMYSYYLLNWDNLIICYIPMTVRKMLSSNSNGKQWPVHLNILGIRMHFHNQSRYVANFCTKVRSRTQIRKVDGILTLKGRLFPQFSEIKPWSENNIDQTFPVKLHLHCSINQGQSRSVVML